MHRNCLAQLLVVWVGLLSAAETPIPPSPVEWVTDTAHFLTPQTVESLNARLAGYEQTTGHQLIVYIAPTTGDAPIEDWAVRAFAKWKVGRKNLDDGLALFIMTQDHKMRIEVGYGLEAVVPDAIASRLINEVMAPKIQAGHPDEAVKAAIDSLIKTIAGQADTLTPPQARTPEPSKPLSPLRMIFYGILGILVLGFFITHPALAFYFLASIMSGGGRGGGGGFGGGGGGGFSGGGGRSGGGGASGSW